MAVCVITGHKKAGVYWGNVIRNPKHVTSSDTE